MTHYSAKGNDDWLHAKTVAKPGDTITVSGWPHDIKYEMTENGLRGPTEDTPS